MKLAFPLAAALAALSITGPAAANGRYPAAGQIALHPSDPSAILVRATFGIVLTKDHGARWDWICEAAVGFGGSEDPMISFTSDGTLLAAIFEGLSVSHDRGCQWAFIGGGLTDHYVVDLAIDKVDASKGVLLISNNTGQDDAGAPTFIGQVWETSDAGHTWAQAGIDLPSDFLGLTLDTAPSDPNRIYVSGRAGPPSYQGLILRSDDRGATWQSRPIPGSDDTRLPYIGAIDPKNPDVVYVRLDAGGPDALAVTKDGGGTWSEVFTGQSQDPGDLLGFALSPDGAKIAIGGPKDGVWIAPSSTLAFTQASSLHARCLTWSPAGLYACGDEATDKLTVGLSTDEGKTFTSLMHLSAPCGPLACDPASSVSTACTQQWPATALTLGSVGCDGAGGAGGSTGSGGGAGAGGSSGGCSCGVPGEGPASIAASAALLALCVAALRRRAR